MTKKKTGAFHGAWMNGTVPADLLRQRLGAERSAKINPAPIIATLSRQMELWRFNLQRQDADPQPAQWADLLHAIKVPDTPNFRDVDTLRAQVEALPVRVAGVLNEVLFKRAEIGRVALFERMMRDATPRNATASPADVVLLRGALVDMIESLRYVRGRRGPKLKQDIGPVLRAVHAAIVTNSRMADVPARELAADLLVMCGIPAPKGRSRLSELFSPAR